MPRPPSRLLSLYLGTAAAFLAVKGAVLLTNALTFPRLHPRETPAASLRPRVSLLVPARDEAHNLPRTLPGLLAQGADEVIVLDDQSSDGTAELARALGASVIRGQPLPEGWYGKPWACQQLGEAASGDVLIFTDADVAWKPGALGAILHELDDKHADLLSVLPRPERLTLGARFLTPLVDAVVLCYLPYPMVSWPQPSLSTGNGQLMAFRCAAFKRVGGYSGVRAQILEDTQLARRLKGQGGRLTLALGASAVGVTMYGSYLASVTGFGKNSLAIHLHSRPLLILSGLWHLAVYTLPWLLPGGRAVLGLRLAGLLERSLVNLVTGRRHPLDLAEGLLAPFTPLLALPAYRRALRRQVTWKGRTYPQK
ncbi:glycosyltransferase [Deinococcus alpinitundrae]|uniref:glycosyltransferase n=1 Tax=Deinococcus alpinitundrae TaxID=468913 RepID=UPI001379680F|nr:glycosyltransferase [Deinococcus alpinitundrae]